MTMFTSLPGRVVSPGGVLSTNGTPDKQETVVGRAFICTLIKNKACTIERCISAPIIPPICISSSSRVLHFQGKKFERIYINLLYPRARERNVISIRGKRWQRFRRFYLEEASRRNEVTEIEIIFLEIKIAHVFIYLLWFNVERGSV